MDINILLSFIEENTEYYNLSEDIKKDFEQNFKSEFKKAFDRGLFYSKGFEDLLLSLSDLQLSKNDLYLRISGAIRLISNDINWKFLGLHEKINKYIDDEIFKLLEPTLYYTDDNIVFSIKDFRSSWPVLWFKLVKTVGYLFEYFKTTFDRIFKDQEILFTEFGVKIEYFETFTVLESDPHNGHQKVICLHFGNGVKVIFKPRSLAGEQYFNQIISSLNQQINLQELKIYNSGNYGYVKWVTAVRNYRGNIAFELGNLLAVATTSGLTDLHAENVILSKKGLIVIDAEAIWLKSLDFTTKNSLRNPDILDIGLLPSPEGLSDTNWWDISTCGFTEDTYTIPISIKYSKTDRPPKYLKHFLKKKISLIKLKLADVKPDQMREEFVRGFKDACDLIKGLRLECPNINDLRYIYRPTGVYHRTLLRMTDYECSKDLKRYYQEVEPYLNELTGGHNESFKPTSIVAAEIVSLLFGDIPRLTGMHLKRAILKDQQINTWSVPDFYASKKLIIGSLGLLRKNNKSKFKFIDSKSYESPKGISELVKFYSDLIVPDVKELVTYGLKTNIESNIPKFSRLEYSLYNGLAGTYLKLAVYNDVAKSEFEPFLKDLDTILSFQFNLQFKKMKTQSASEGVFGILYSYAYLYKLGINRSRNRELLMGLIKILPENLAFFNNQNLDVVSGVSGLLLILDAVGEVIDDPKLCRLKNCIVDVILDQQLDNGGWVSLERQELAGFSHGAAGIRYALGRFYLKNKYRSREVLKSMGRALNFEDDLYDPIQLNWSDMRFSEQNKRLSNFSAWCHGAAGISLSEAGLIDMELSDRKDRVNVALSLNSKAATIKTRTSLCCGQGAYYSLLINKKSSIYEDNMEINKISLEISQDDNYPGSLFRSSYGVDFLKTIYRSYANAPTLLLFE